MIRNIYLMRRKKLIECDDHTMTIEIVESGFGRGYWTKDSKTFKQLMSISKGSSIMGELQNIFSNYRKG